ncbi:MAG: 50S ribosomal protein L28 [Candidatus Sericytochromatia bacterium]|nr:50S ribosomal protein L28 [Candidatus Sericytochromatia bacterium]
MSRVCAISGKRRNTAHNVSHSQVKTKRVQQPNLQTKRFWLAEEGRWVRLRVSTKVMKTIARHGLAATLKRYGADPGLLR